MAVDVGSYCSSADVLDYFSHFAESFLCGRHPRQQAATVIAGWCGALARAPDRYRATVPCLLAIAGSGVDALGCRNRRQANYAPRVLDDVMTVGGGEVRSRSNSPVSGEMRT